MKRAEIGYNPPASNQGDSHAGKFPPTHWHLLYLRAKDSNANCRKQLASLCRAYWYSLYSFIRG